MNNMRYADDAVLIAGSMQEIQELVNRVVSKSDKAGLLLNVDKTKVMKIEANSPSDKSLVINGETVEEINHYNYLGATITTAYCRGFPYTLRDLRTPSQRSFSSFIHSLTIHTQLTHIMYE